MTGRGLLVAQVGRAKGVRNARACRTLAGCKDMARTEAGSNSITPITFVTILYYWVREHVRALYFCIFQQLIFFSVRASLSSGLSKGWKVQTVLGTVLVYLCLQVFCWIASLTVLMRTLASICFMYLHVPWPFICSRKTSSGDLKDQPPDWVWLGQPNGFL